jgi:ribosome-associated toxin RatA of RatAB toxin-antitoxin module
MAQASATIDIPASPDEVWQLIGGFGSLPDWLPYIPKSELIQYQLRQWAILAA